MTNTPILTTTDLFTTVALTRITPRGAALAQYSTNDGQICVWQQATDETLQDKMWAVGRLGADRPFVQDLATLEEAIDFILGARAMMAPA